MTPKGLGYRTPTDTRHLEKYPLRLSSIPVAAERQLVVNRVWRQRYDQGTEGACVGFACSMAMSILNRAFFDARWLYQQAQLIDDWDETPPEEGTSIRAGLDILRKQGHRRMYGQKSGPIKASHGIESNHWVGTVDDAIRCLADGIPLVMGVNWRASFNAPEPQAGPRGTTEWWIGMKPDLGRMQGGHAICATGVSSRRGAIRWTNSWGLDYPQVWVPFEVLDRLLHEGGQIAVITDRTGAPVVPREDV